MAEANPETDDPQRLSDEERERMKRHGGTASITSTADGTEVRLGLPALSTDNAEGKS